jgi:pyrroloquinoline-quinone synthase
VVIDEGGRPVTDFWTQLEGVRARWNVLEHPFYQRWSQGSLSGEELARYAGEYRHAVVALAEAAAAAARVADDDLRPQLEAHAVEEASHIALWDGFSRAVGGDLSVAPTPQTRECARAWAGDGERPLLRSLVALYAIESGQPAISATKLQGLREHYGVDGGEGTAYFELHAELDHEHAAAERALIEERLEGADVAALLAEAESVLRANWHLLDGVAPARAD